MTAGYCRHDWTSCNETLRASFPTHQGMEREFRVCKRCLRIEEGAPEAASAAPFAVPQPKREGGSGEGDEQAA